MPSQPPSRPSSTLRRKATVAVSGTATIGLGILLLPLPGPGMVVIFAGLTILSREFPSAARLLDRMRASLRRRFLRTVDRIEPENLPESTDGRPTDT